MCVRVCGGMCLAVSVWGSFFVSLPVMHDPILLPELLSSVLTPVFFSSYKVSDASSQRGAGFLLFSSEGIPLFLLSRFFWLFPCCSVCASAVTHVPFCLVFLPGPRPCHLCCEVSAGSMASVQGFDSSPFPLPPPPSPDLRSQAWLDWW